VLSVSDHSKKETKKKDEANAKLTSDLKASKHELSVQLKIVNNSESNNRKYLSALVESQGLISSLCGKVTGALGDMATIKVEKIEAADTDIKVKTEPSENGEGK